jgi:hypothetical protein
MPEEGLATTEAKPTDAAAPGAANPAEAPPVKPATGTVSTPAVSAAPAAPAQASTSSSQLGNESSSSAAAAAAKPKLTSEEIEKVEFCRRYLTEVNNDRAASKETIVHALKIKTTLGEQRRHALLQQPDPTRRLAHTRHGIHPSPTRCALRRCHMYLYLCFCWQCVARCVLHVSLMFLHLTPCFSSLLFSNPSLYRDWDVWSREAGGTHG